jgi:hypothetical protein
MVPTSRRPTSNEGREDAAAKHKARTRQDADGKKEERRREPAPYRVPET